MKRFKYILIVLIGIGVLYYYFIINKQDGTVPEFSEIKVRNAGQIDFSLAEPFTLDSSVTVINQKNTNRIIEDLDYSSHKTIYIESIRPPVYFTNIKVHNETFYILDHDKTFKVFDSNFEYISTIGLGTGRGPGELQLATDFTIQSSNRLVTACPVSMKVVSYDINSSKFSEHIVKNATNAIMIDDIVYYSSFMSDYFIYKYDTRLDEQIGVFNLILDHEQSINALNSFSALSDIHKKWCFVFIYAGYFMCLDLDSDIYMVAETMSKPGYLPYKYSTNGSMTVVSEYLPSGDISVYNDKVIILSGHLEKNNSVVSTIFDVYNINNLQYMSSFSVPGNFLRFDIENNILLAHNREKDFITLFSFADLGVE